MNPDGKPHRYLDPRARAIGRGGISQVAEATGLKLGKLAQPLRAALTGKTTSPGIFDVLALLGRDESLGRIADQMLEPNA